MWVVGGLALAAGFSFRSVGIRAAQAASFIFPYRFWRVVRIGPLAISIPPGWGDLEPDADGGFILHNCPRRFRIDGDAVWYASAIELRIHQRGLVTAVDASVMMETTRTILCPSGPMFLTLAVANGVGNKRHRQAIRVLERVTVDAGNRPIVSGPPEREHPESDMPVFHPRISGPVRR